MRLFEQKIRKSNDLIRAEEVKDAAKAKMSAGLALKARLATPARRIFAMLVAALNETPDQRNVEINLNDIEAATGSNLLTKDYALCVSAIGMTNYIIKTDKKFHQIQIFDEIEYEYGSKKVHAHFTEKGAAFINDVTPFTKYYLSDYLSLSSTYAQTLFEFLKSWEKQKEIIVSISELQKLLHFPDYYTKDKRELKRRVLETARADMEEKINFFFSYKFNAVYRPDKVIFTIGKKEKPQKVLKPKQAAYLCARNLVNKNICCKIYGDAKYEYKDYAEEQKCTQCRICKYLDNLRQKKLAKQAEQIKKDGLFE